MQEYHFYAGAPGALAPVPMADPCSSDTDAFMIATRLASDATEAEVWQGFRLVCRVPAKRPPSKQWPRSR